MIEIMVAALGATCGIGSLALVIRSELALRRKRQRRIEVWVEALRRERETYGCVCDVCAPVQVHRREAN